MLVRMCGNTLWCWWERKNSAATMEDSLAVLTKLNIVSHRFTQTFTTQNPAQRNKQQQQKTHYKNKQTKIPHAHSLYL